jgi:molybdopterin/thiamine biosynthesis adenylyltransferase
MASSMTEKWSIVMTRPHWEELHAHLFPGDRDEHGAVLRCGISTFGGRSRLLVHDVVLAEDGIDYVPGTRGYRRMVPEFVLEAAESCADDELIYIGVHCHGGRDVVEFSSTDLASHERGYPALLDITDAPAVGGLVFASNAVAGDIWTSEGRRFLIDELRIVGRPEARLYPAPPPAAAADLGYNRQARIFGDRGQELLSSMKIGIIGLGGAGSLLNEYVARLGVGELMLVDPDRIEISNLSRVVGARRLDALTWLTGEGRPLWLRELGKRFSAPKVRIASRVARQASRRIKVSALMRDVLDSEVADLLKSCDHIFLAADSHSARRLVDVLTHQHFIPSTQVGAKVSVDSEGRVTDIFAVSRSSSPGAGCLRCNRLVLPRVLQEEAKSDGERRRQRYLDDDDVPAPSVITLNALAVSQAVNDWLMSVMGLLEEGADQHRWAMFLPSTDELDEAALRRDPDCPNCGPDRFARGDQKRLPVKMQPRKSVRRRGRST